MTDAVRCNRITNSAANGEIELVLREWLRTAADRDGGRQKREEKKRQRLSSSADARTSQTFGWSPEESAEQEPDVSECDLSDVEPAGPTVSTDDELQH
jgi:hypothetical protein